MTTAGDLWIDGSTLRYIDSNGAEWAYEGEVEGRWIDLDGKVIEEATEAVWIEGHELRYVDADGYTCVPQTTEKGSTDGMPGSIWIENSRIAFVADDQQKVVLGEPGAEGGGSEVDIQVEEISVEPSTVSAGESVDLSITYTNVGATGTDTERVYVGDRLVYENEFEIEGGASGTVSGSVDTEETDAGATSLTFELPSSGVSETVDLTVVEPSAGDVDVTIERFEVEKDYATVGETVEYSGKFTNTGSGGTSRQHLYAGDVLVDKWSPTLGAGETREGTNEITITEEYLGAEELRIEFVDSGAAKSAELNVVSDETSFDPWILSFDAKRDEVKAGESVSVDVTVHNLSDQGGTEVTRVWVGDRIEREHQYDWSANEKQETTVEVETVPADAGAQEIRVEFLSSGSSESTDVRVWDACMERDATGLLVDELDAPDQLQVGESATVDVSFTLCGDDGTVVSPALYAGDTQLWSTLDVVDHRDRVTRTVDLVPQAGDWGTLTLRAESGDDEREHDVEVQPLPFGVSFDGSPTVDGGTVTAAVEVSNGDFEAADRQPVELLVDGEVVDSTEVELESLGSTAVELSGPISPGEHTVAVATATDEVSTPIDVPEPAGDVSASVGDVRDPITHAASELTVPTAVENAGSGETEVEVRVTTDAGVATGTTTVLAGETATVSPTVPVEPSPDSDVTVDVAARSPSGTVLDETSTAVGVAGELDLSMDGVDPKPSGADGLYRDVDGDGEIGHTDVVEFFGVQHRPPMKQPAYFDFSGNGVVGHGDVVELFEYVARQPL